jgi:threonine/homoserine/homoserine lactone efflux protein
VAASAGVTAVLVASEPAFLAVKLLGAAYLIWLGVQALRIACSSAEQATNATGPRSAVKNPYRQGLLSDLGNPKMAAFFTSLLPQFVPGAHPSFWLMLALGLTFCALTFAWLAAYAAAVAKARDVLRRPRVRRAIEGLTGVVLIGLGVRVATEQR